MLINICIRQDGEVLIENQYLSFDPTQRMCTYVKAGSRMDPPEVTIVIENKGPCPREYKCARNK